MLRADSSCAPARHERTGTPVYLKTDVRGKLQALKDQLPEADSMLLEMRVAQRFSFKEIAQVFLGPDATDDDAAIAREAARLRKRFQLTSQNLRNLARAQGLLDEE